MLFYVVNSAVVYLRCYALHRGIDNVVTSATVAMLLDLMTYALAALLEIACI